MRTNAPSEINSLTYHEKIALIHLQQRLALVFQLNELIIFGSKARGDNNEWSDLDVLVLVEDEKNWHNRELLSDIVYEINLQYDTQFSALYYSAFQYVTALILTRGEKVSNKHIYVRGWVNKNLGATGLLPVELAKLYNRLMDHRAEADYSATVSFLKEDVSHLVEQVKTFNQAIAKIMEQEAAK